MKIRLELEVTIAPSDMVDVDERLKALRSKLFTATHDDFEYAEKIQVRIMAPYVIEE